MVTATESEEQPGACVRTRRALVVLAGLVAAMLAGLPWLVHPWYDPTNDGAMYVLTGRALVDGEGYSMLGQPFRIRPPGFSLLIAPLLAWQRADPFFALNVFVSLFGVAACGLLFWWARARVGTLLAVGLAVAIWCNPGFRELSNQPMSDVPGVALLFLCLLVERRADRARSARGDAWLAAVIGLSALVRSQLVLLVPCIVAMRLVRRLLPAAKGEEREAWRNLVARLTVLVLVVGATQLPWHLRNRFAPGEPPADQTRLWSYETAMWHEDMGDPASRRLELDEVLARIPQRGGQLLGVLDERLPGPEPREASPGRVPWVAFGLLASVVWVACKHRAASELFVLGSTLLVSLYFGFAPRLALPLYVLALPDAVEAVRDVLRLLLRPVSVRVAGGPLPTLVTAALLAGLVAHDFVLRPGWKGIELEHRQLASITERFAARVEEDAVLASNRPWHYAVFLDRPVYALEFVVRRTGDPRDVEALIDRYGIDTVVLSPAVEKDLEVLPYFEAVYGPQTSPLARVYRVRS